MLSNNEDVGVSTKSDRKFLEKDFVRTLFALRHDAIAVTTLKFYERD